MISVLATYFKTARESDHYSPDYLDYHYYHHPDYFTITVDHYSFHHSHHHPNNHDYHSPWMETHVAGPPLLSQSLATPNLLKALSFQWLTVTWNLRFIIRHLFTNSLKMCKWVGEEVGSGPGWLPRKYFKFSWIISPKKRIWGKGGGVWLNPTLLATLKRLVGIEMGFWLRLLPDLPNC